MKGICERCGLGGELQRHHRKLRSQLGDDSESNLVEICPSCHAWAHANPEEAYATGWMVKSWDEPADVVPLQLTVNGREVPHAEVVASHPHELAPGVDCPTCHRRVPHPKKKDSPKSKVFSFRGPQEGADELTESLVLVAEHMGISTKEPYWKFKTVLFALAEASS